MTLALFCLLSPEVQLRYALVRGTYLAYQWKEEGASMLYYLPDEGRGFFVELGVDEEQTYFFVLRSFRDSEPLEEYVHAVRLPE